MRLVIVYIAKQIDESGSTNKFTDTDYEVFSDAATHVYNGGSPFARHTYRYTPLAAYICLVNNVIHPLAGKILFCLCDIAIGLIYWRITEHQRNSLPSGEKTWQTITVVACWIFNPLNVVIPTRGSNDNIILLLVFIALYFLLKKAVCTRRHFIWFVCTFQDLPNHLQLCLLLLYRHGPEFDRKRTNTPSYCQQERLFYEKPSCIYNCLSRHLHWANSFLLLYLWVRISV